MPFAMLYYMYYKDTYLGYRRGLPTLPRTDTAMVDPRTIHADIRGREYTGHSIDPASPIYTWNKTRVFELVFQFVIECV